MPRDRDHFSRITGASPNKVTDPTTHLLQEGARPLVDHKAIK